MEVAHFTIDVLVFRLFLEKKSYSRYSVLERNGGNGDSVVFVDYRFGIRNNIEFHFERHIVIKNHTASIENLTEILGEDVDIVYIDPARRGEGGKKVFLIEDCTPDVLTLKNEIFRKVRHILIKLSPMADITMVCNRLGNTCREVHVVGTAGECKELLIWLDREWNNEYTIVASELNTDGVTKAFTFKPSDEKSAIPTYGSSVGKFLFEPGKALMKAGAFNLIQNQKSLHATSLWTRSH